MAKQVTVLMFGWEFPPYNSGGLGTACLGLTKALASDCNVVFVLPRKVSLDSSNVRFRFADEHSSQVKDVENIKIREINSLLSPYLTTESYSERLSQHLILGGEQAKDFYGSTLYEEVMLYARRAREVAEQEEFDVIHAHDWLAFGAGVEAKRISGKPLIVHVHATEYDRSGGNGVNGRVFEIEKEGMEEADHVIAVSEYTRRIIIEHYGIPEDKVSVVYNGTDCASDMPTEEKRLESPLWALKRAGSKVVLFVGRITLQKGPEYFLRAAQRVLDYYPNTVFVVAGSGDMEEKMMREAAALGISDRVLFAGFVRGASLEAAYRAADLYVMPSVSEPFGLTALEAVEHGTPVLLSKQSGVSEVVRHSLRVDFWDTDDMANKIVSTLFHGSIGRELKKNAFRELGNLSWRKAAEKCRDLYQWIVEKAAEEGAVLKKHTLGKT